MRPRILLQPDNDSPYIPTSRILQRLIDDAPAGRFTLNWVLGRLQARSFGVIMLLLAVVAMGPAISPIAGLLLAIPAVQMIMGQPAPTFPRRIGERPLPIRYLAVIVQRVVPALRYLENFFHPRWPTPIMATRRFVGVLVLVLDLAVMLIPIPFSNVPPALVIAMTALAYLEEDGVLLAVALLAGLVIVAVVAAGTWGAVLGADWITRIW